MENGQMRSPDTTVLYLATITPYFKARLTLPKPTITNMIALGAMSTQARANTLLIWNRCPTKVAREMGSEKAAWCFHSN